MITEARAVYNGVNTRVLAVAGDGIPVVLLHGYGDSADTWLPVLTGLGRSGRRALAVDLPGLGSADRWADGPLLPQFDDFTDAIIAGLGDVVLVGNSLGAATAVRASGRNGGSVKGLVALDDPLNANHWLARIARSGGVPEGLWWCARHLRLPAGAVEWATAHALRSLLYGPDHAPDREVIDRWIDAHSSVPDVVGRLRSAFVYAYETRGGHRDVSVSCPTVIVHGARDRLIPEQASHVLHEQIPGSELVILGGSGHCPQLDNPAAVVRLIVGLDASGRTGSHQTG